MATIRKRNNKWQVQIRRRGAKPFTRSFSAKGDAERWARLHERQADLGEVAGIDAECETVLCDLIQRYIDEVCPLKRSAGDYESILLDAFCRRAPDIVRQPATKLTTSDFAGYRMRRLEEVSGETLRRELGVIQHVYEIAGTEWGISISNPLKQLRKPNRNRARDRRLQPEEAQALQIALEACRNPMMKPLVNLAIQTAMRRGELLSVTWRDWDAAAGVLHIRQTKNGHPRRIPISPAANSTLTALRPAKVRLDDRLISLTPTAVRQAWDRLVKRAEIEDLHFHDLRHEAISSFFEKGLSLPEVALISGHRDPRQLMRYTHLDAARVARKLREGDSDAVEI